MKRVVHAFFLGFIILTLGQLCLVVVMFYLAGGYDWTVLLLVGLIVVLVSILVLLLLVLSHARRRRQLPLENGEARKDGDAQGSSGYPPELTLRNIEALFHFLFR